MELELKQEFSVKWKLEIEMKLLEKMELELKQNFFQNGNNTGSSVLENAIFVLSVQCLENYWTEFHLQH